ncbi:hypothetical protein FIBSPDRAFT_854471 [Athelia psychrophila]|uniref:N-acetyltransferase domain-containing protein n=1 Tax=Athelia psychrophila TaxID=1759441 RepID=A0A166Q5Z8_9AGAM|nr:hypothetical protein FIBSPDRAFT_854471 [Fibularhizoctonia sp. CBS 109695]
MGWGDPSPEARPESALPALAAACEKAFASRGYGMYAVSLTPRGEFIGYIQLRNLDDTTEAFRSGYERWFPRQGEVEVLYALDPGSWGRGYAKEMVRGLLEETKGRVELERVTACVMPGNGGSQRVLEDARLTRTDENLGYSKEGDLYYVLERGAGAVGARSL